MVLGSDFELGFCWFKVKYDFLGYGLGSDAEMGFGDFQVCTFHTYSDFGLINIGFNNCDSGFSYLVIGSDRFIVGMESVTLALFF